MSRGGSTIGTVLVTTLVTSAAWVGVGAANQDKLAGCETAAPTSPSPRPSVAVSAIAPSPRSALPVPVSGHLTMPVVGVRPSALVNTFRDARSEGRVHDAIDIMAPRGTPVVAAAPGRVEKLFLSKAGGLTVYVRSPDGSTIYYYAHLDAYDPALVEGRSLTAGTPIGRVGSTGNASADAPHLHFAVWKTAVTRKWYEDGEAVNPYDLLR